MAAWLWLQSFKRHQTIGCSRPGAAIRCRPVPSGLVISVSHTPGASDQEGSDASGASSSHRARGSNESRSLTVYGAG